MKARRTSFSLVALLFAVSLAVPQALANPTAMRPLQSSGSTPSPSEIPCMGYNGVDDSYIPRIVNNLRVALIKPVLTTTPYSKVTNGSFYAFYAKEKGVTTNVTTDLNLLSTNVSSGYRYNQGWGLSYGEYQFFTSQAAVNCGLQVGKNVQILTDMDVANGALFDSQNASRFDVVVLPFSEYVEASEYIAYENFVAGGGTLLMMAHSLEYPVTYNATTHVETFVYGHGWAFNGKYAYPIACGAITDASCPWAKNSTDWIGSTSCLSCSRTYRLYRNGWAFVGNNGSVVNTGSPIGKAISKEFGGKIFRSYVSHEENTITNMSGTSIVSVLLNASTNLIASYTRQFGKGTVVNFGLFGDDIIRTDPSAQYFMLLGVVDGRVEPSATLTSSTTVLTSSTTVLTSLSTISSTLDQTPTSTGISKSPGTLPSTLAGLGGLAMIGVVAGALVVSRRRGSSS